MHKTMTRTAALTAALALALVGCSSGSDDGTPTDTGGDTGTQTTSAGGSDSTPPTGGNTGSATLTVDGNTYEFDNYYCFQGGANTGNERVSFSSGAMGEVDGVRVQLDASIQDTNEGDAMDGAGTIQSVSLNDIEDFTNPSVSWEAVTGFFGEPAWVIEYDGSTVHAEALFDDGLTDDLEELPGTLDATCP
ncbi:MAG: hypothetical protein KDB69_07440 [Acidimicrobiia bacterium]|nr:hypothetical protein [Acidimicrobiia bacterium]